MRKCQSRMIWADERKKYSCEVNKRHIQKKKKIGTDKKKKWKGKKKKNVRKWK